MTDPPSHSGSDPLSGSPELFATNLLIVRCIENEMEGVRLRKTDGGVRVRLQRSSREYEEETLTDDPSRWEPVRQRFREHTVSRSDGPDELRVSTPAARSLESIRVEYPDEETVQLTFDYPED